MGNVNMEATQIIYRDSAGKKNVAEALKNAKGGYDYSTTEYDTNSKWIDGHEIYGIIVPVEISTTEKTSAVDLNLGETATVVGLSAIAYGTTNSKDIVASLPQGSGYEAPTTGTSLRYNATDKKLQVSGNNTNFGGYTAYVEVRYIKAVFPAPAPEPTP